MIGIANLFRRNFLDLARSRTGLTITTFGLLPLLSGCAHQVAEAVSQAPDTPGFWLGLWHGFIFPVAWVISLFDPSVAIYAVPNNGGWYDFGYFVGIVFFGVGAKKTQTVTKTVYVDRWGGRVIDQ
jgi:hypothetical protein